MTLAQELEIPVRDVSVSVYHEELGFLNVDFRTLEDELKNYAFLEKAAERPEFISFGAPSPFVEGVHQRLRLDLADVRAFSEFLRELGTPLVGWEA